MNKLFVAYKPTGMSSNRFLGQIKRRYQTKKAGYSGTLDRDDRTGYGPEHYNVPSCETLEEGIYHIALDYYKGDGPEIATVQIEAGLLVRTYEIPMPSEYYGSPNYPKLIANIQVSKNENDDYDFEIYK